MVDINIEDIEIPSAPSDPQQNKTLVEKLSDIGESIRSKTGKSDLLSLDEMPAEIESISGGDDNGSVLGWKRPSYLPNLDNFEFPSSQLQDCVILTVDPKIHRGNNAFNKLYISIVQSASAPLTKTIYGYKSETKETTLISNILITPAATHNMLISLEAYVGVYDYLVCTFTSAVSTYFKQMSTANYGKAYPHAYNNPIIEQKIRAASQGEFRLNCRHTLAVQAAVKTCMSAYFNQMASVKAVDFSGSSFASWNGLFASLTQLQYVRMEPASHPTNIATMFNGCRSLKSVNFEDFDLSQVTSMQGFMQNCTVYDKPIVFKENAFMNTEFTASDPASYCFVNCPLVPGKLEIKGGDWSMLTRLDFTTMDTVEEIIFLPEVFTPTRFTTLTMPETQDYNPCNLRNFELPRGVQCNINVKGCPLLSHDCLVKLIDCLHDFSSAGGTHTLALGSINLAKLSSAERLVGTSKGWTVSA